MLATVAATDRPQTVGRPISTETQCVGIPRIRTKPTGTGSTKAGAIVNTARAQQRAGAVCGFHANAKRRPASYSSGAGQSALSLTRPARKGWVRGGEAAMARATGGSRLAWPVQCASEPPRPGDPVPNRARDGATVARPGRSRGRLPTGAAGPGLSATRRGPSRPRKRIGHAGGWGGGAGVSPTDPGPGLRGLAVPLGRLGRAGRPAGARQRL